MNIEKIEKFCHICGKVATSAGFGGYLCSDPYCQNMDDLYHITEEEDDEDIEEE